LNTLTNAYVKKISSGTILALLAISGLLFLVPVATPVFAANASLPTVAVTANSIVLDSSANVVTLKISNPAGNSYTITGFSVAAPSGWTVTGTTAGGYLPSHSNTASGALWTVSTFTVGTGAGIPPGQSDVVTFTATAPGAGSFPINSVFTSEVQDASAVAYYAGPSFSILVIDHTTVTTITVTPAGSNTATSYTAGTAVYTVTATVTAAEAQSGLTIVWSDGGSGAASATYPSSFGSATSTTSAATATTATATTTFQPSEVKTLTGVPTATIGTCVSVRCTAADGSTIVTVAGSPSTVTVTAGATSTQTDYITFHGTGGYTGAVLSGEVAAGGLTGQVADAFGNTVTSGITFAAGQQCVITTFGGLFDLGVPTPSSTDTLAGGGAGCTAAGAITSAHPYYQPSAYGSTTFVQIVMTGTYNAAAFTASGKSQSLTTSSFDAAAVLGTPGLSTSVAAGNIGAGSAAGVASTITLTYTLTNAQAGVPITFLSVNTTNPYTGSFVGGNGLATHKDPANITVATTVTSGVATATAKFTVDTAVGDATTFKAEFANPITVPPDNPSHIIGPSPATGAFTTIAGAASKLLVNAYFDQALAHKTTKSIAPQSLWIDVFLADFWATQQPTQPANCR